ncbi:hypothetical protein [Pseudonocardia sp. SCN 73-27]|uniref:hypothetical protein n=1 Tax=Pseudonocardia sp. SCN 73-27 TaxID=1660132 RepID=UPI0025CC285F|nr:hypothetical protein [Pseudonocardia sp. SCN 73-27]
MPTAQRPLREAEFDALFARAVTPLRRTGPTRLLVRLPAVDADVARRLSARESDCCSFFAFDVRVSAGETLLGIEVPSQHTDVLDRLSR